VSYEVRHVPRLCCSRSEEARWKYNGKNVVIVGSSNSACEIAAELAGVCTQVLTYLMTFRTVSL